MMRFCFIPFAFQIFSVNSSFFLKRRNNSRELEVGYALRATHIAALLRIRRWLEDGDNWLPITLEKTALDIGWLMGWGTADDELRFRMQNPSGPG
jgi:hypothetical protein